MNKQTAYKIISDELRLLSDLSPTEATKRVEENPVLQKKDETGTEYTIELETSSNDRNNSITITGTIINTGQWNFDPLTEKIAIKNKSEPGD